MAHDPELGTNGLHDLAPTADLSIPALRAHFEMRRARTLEAIDRALKQASLTHPLRRKLAQQVLDELEKMWREDEAFS